MLLLSARCGALLPLTRCTGRRRLALRAETIAAETDAVEYVVKRSRFVAHAAPCTSFDEAEAARHRDDKARHNCWAWVGAGRRRA